MAILKADGMPYEKKPIRDEIARPTIGSIRNIWSTYPSNSLTPERLAAIFKEADQGSIYRQMELFEEMEEKDPHLFSVLQTRKRSVSNLPWEIISAGESSQEKKIAEAVKEYIKAIPRFRKALRDLMDAVGKGFSVSEIIWGVSGKEIYVERLEWRHQKWFTFDQETGSELRLVTDSRPIEGEALPPGKFIVPMFQAKSGILARGGILRICAWMFLFKNYDVKDWVTFAEVFGMPMRIGKYPAGASDKDLEILREAVINLGQDAAAVIPNSMLIEFQEAQKTGSLNIYESLANYCDRQMSKGVLGQTLTTESGEKGGGGYALGNVHNDVRYDLLCSDTEELSEVITSYLVKPLVFFNYGKQKRYPEFRMTHTKPVDLEKIARTMKTLGESGFKTIPISWVHKKFGIPEPKEGEEVLQPPNNTPNMPLPARNEPGYILAAKKKLKNLAGYHTENS